MEVWHLALGQNLPLDELITHHLAVANVFTTVDPLLDLLRLPSFLGQSSMESRQQWLTRLKNELSNSPLVSNVAFGFILMGLEKLVELEFECPCSPTWNGVFSSAFFIIPAVMAFTLMLIIQGCRCDKGCRKTMSLSSFVPAIVWLILLFLDGQYFACAMTDWEGRFVLVDKAAPQKWCEPVSEGDVTPQELMLRSQQLFVYSQVSETLLFSSTIQEKGEISSFLSVCLYSPHTPGYRHHPPHLHLCGSHSIRDQRKLPRGGGDGGCRCSRAHRAQHELWTDQDLLRPLTPPTTPTVLKL